MADLSITVAVTTGTQYVTGSTGSIYTFNGSQPASFTFPWVASGTVRLEQSGSSNDGHPLIFSTSNSSVLATMKAGIISSGVTYYLDGSSNESDYTNTTTFNAATTRYIEIAPASETDFYFACWVHGIGMGGIMDMTQDTWGALSWGDHTWGEQDTINVFPTGLLTTGSLGTPAAYSEQGWGRAGYGDEPWGDSYDPVIAVVGYSITASLGTLDYAGAIEGWGRDEWGYGNWGENTTTVPLASSFEMSVGLGTEGWGRSTWGNDAWGEQSTVNIEIGHPVTGFAITGSLGTPQIDHDFIFTLSDSLLLTASRGSLSINNGADHTQGLGGLAATMSLGTPLVADVVFGPSSFLATMALGTATSDELIKVPVTGYSITASQGSIGSIPDMGVGVSGYSITGSVGTITPDDVVGLTGYSITASLNSASTGVIGYKDVDITGYTTYTDVTHSG